MKIVIADDEQLILTWLKKNLEALSPDYQVVYTCVNGQQAMEYCLEYPVDLLFTDVRMPLMDGIGLIRVLKAQLKMPYTVILTAYDDFSYAREALKLGAKEFLLKAEITEQMLLDCMNHASKEVQSRPVTSVVDELTTLLAQFVGQEQVDLPLLEQLLSARTNNGVAILLAQAQSAERLQQCRELLFHIYAEEQLTLIAIPIDEMKWAIFSTQPQNSDSFVRRSQQLLQSFGLANCYLGMASSGQVTELEQVWKRAQEGLQYQRYYQSTAPSTFSSMHKLALEEREVEIAHLIEIDAYPQAIDAIEGWLDLVAQVRPPVARIKRIGVRFLLMFYWEKLSEQERRKISVDEVVSMVHADDFDTFRTRLLMQLAQLRMVLQARGINTYTPAVTQAMLFIKQHYQEPLSLEDIADQVHLNRTYLSSLFKKETTINLSDYLQRCRIEASKPLLSNKEQSVQQVCEQVGIADGAYFSKIFKKHTGMTPAEYRKRGS